MKLFYNLFDFHLKSAEKANELWFNSDLNWKDFLVSEQNIEDFVKKNVSFVVIIVSKMNNWFFVFTKRRLNSLLDQSIGSKG